MTEKAIRENHAAPWLTWIGHATWLVQLAGKNILIDPIWAKRISGVVPRQSEPGVAIKDLPSIDAVLVSHNHRDHMDAPTLKQFAHAEAIVPKGCGAQMRSFGFTRITELQWWQSHTLGDATIHFVPSQHWSRRSLFDINAALWGGFVIAGGGARVYHSGDTAYFDGFKEIGERLGPIDAAMLPIGAYDPEWFMRKQHMNPQDAVQAFKDLKAKRMLPMHWATYQLTDEWLGEPPEKLHALAPEVAIVALGETVKLDPAEALLHLWFTALKPEQWFKIDPKLDQALREQFLFLLRAPPKAWLDQPRTRLAYIILLDQFSRNVFRGSGEAFANDAEALRVAEEGVTLGMDQTLSENERAFFYLPFMHAESLAVQDRSVALFTDLAKANNLDFARRHREVVARFGRFPHRNAALGRASTPEEEAFIKEHNGF